MIDIVFVILIYNIFEESIKCIDSIEKNIDTKNYKVIIVDNGSSNNIGKRLAARYKSNNRVSVRALDVNLGFAKGNNVGIKIARELKPKFICCLNDDTRLLSKRLFRNLNHVYRKYKPALIGPKIIERNGNECNYNHSLKTIEEYKAKLNDLKCERFDNNSLNNAIYYIKGLRTLVPIKKIWHYVHSKLLAKSCDYETDTLDLVLQGSCIFFTPIFFTYLYGFNPDTFLYYEEDLLFASVKAKKMHSLYTPSISFAHLRGISTSKTLKQRKQIWEFTHKYYIESLEILIRYLEENHNCIYSN